MAVITVAFIFGIFSCGAVAGFAGGVWATHIAYTRRHQELERDLALADVAMKDRIDDMRRRDANFSRRVAVSTGADATTPNSAGSPEPAIFAPGRRNG